MATRVKTIRQIQDDFLRLPKVVGFAKRLGIDVFLFEPGSPTIRQVREQTFLKYRSEFEKHLNGWDISLLAQPADRVAPLPTPPSSTSTRCRCGCGEIARGRFLPGHDARFHGRQKRLADGRLSWDELIQQLGKTGEYALSHYKGNDT